MLPHPLYHTILTESALQHTHSIDYECLSDLLHKLPIISLPHPTAAALIHALLVSH